MSWLHDPPNGNETYTDYVARIRDETPEDLYPVHLPRRDQYMSAPQNTDWPLLLHRRPADHQSGRAVVSRGRALRGPSTDRDNQ